MLSTRRPRACLRFRRRRLPLELQVGAVDLTDWKADLGLIRQPDGHCMVRFVSARDNSIEVLQRAVAYFHRLAEDDFSLLPDKTNPIFPAQQLPLHPWGADFELVGSRNNIFDVQNGSHLLRYEFAVSMSDPGQFIDDDQKHLVAAAALEIDLNYFDPFGLRGPLGDFPDLCHRFRSIHARFQ